ncbi:fungal-specific transcription factor domain-containing protein [Coniochaeta sp. 2T2.1]|nr:fungal-specific transcription factor domain-containing protein [Coniochaeta sp. 2T2.1]
MPRILPMKANRVGTSSHSRITQACDRFGFECRTSDKLSRRAFPQGYTESLEEHDRQSELEVKGLKDLLDEKDEKINMLSMMHGNRRKPSLRSASGSTPALDFRKDANLLRKEDTFRIQAPPLILGVENSDSFYMGGYSGRVFIEAFKRKIKENGKTCSDFDPDAFLHVQGCYPLTAEPPSQSMKVPTRLFSDCCVNIYLKEWAPLFPVIHKPTFLMIYEEFVSDPEKIRNNHKLAQKSLNAILMNNTMVTLQCLVLTVMYCTVRADYKRLQHFKAIAVSLSHRLGLHQSQKRFSFGPLEIENRKKVFWTLYTLDCFSAAILGPPRILKEDEIHAEYPSDIDDEYVNEEGFQPSLPGEHTRISSALALFRGTRILAKLDNWCDNLPQHLRLTFRQEKLSTDIMGSGSPLLALAFYYTKTLIYRPAVGSSLGPKAAAALISIREYSKHIVKVVQLLEESSMSFAFCLNKADTLVLCGLTLLYEILDLGKESNIIKDNARLTNAAIRIMDKSKAPGSLHFKQIAAGLILFEEQPRAPTPPYIPPQQRLATCMPAPSRTLAPISQAPSYEMVPSLGRHGSASINETDLLLPQSKARKMAMPPSGQSRPKLYNIRSQRSFDAVRPEPFPLLQRIHRLSSSQGRAAQATVNERVPSTPNTSTEQNLDHLSFNSTASRHRSPVQPRSQERENAKNALYSQLEQIASSTSMADWEALVVSLDDGQPNLYDAIYVCTKFPAEANLADIVECNKEHRFRHLDRYAIDGV